MPQRLPSLPVVIVGLALLGAVIAATVVLLDRGSGAAGGPDVGEADLDAAIAFLEDAIRVDTRPLEGEIFYWRSESYDRGGSQAPGVRESWSRIGEEGRIVESLHRAWDEDGNLRDERHTTEPSASHWTKEEAAGARSGLVSGSARLIELTDETVTVEQRYSRPNWDPAPAYAQGIDDPQLEIMRLTIDAQGHYRGRELVIRTAAGDEVLAQSDTSTITIVDEMPQPGDGT